MGLIKVSLFQSSKNNGLPPMNYFLKFLRVREHYNLALIRCDWKCLNKLTFFRLFKAIYILIYVQDIYIRHPRSYRDDGKIGVFHVYDIFGMIKFA